MTEARLPLGFADSAQYVADWVRATEIDRNKFCVARIMAELQAFYESTMPRLEATSKYLNEFPFSAMPRDCLNLREPALMTMEVAPAVEYGKFTL